MHFTFVATSPSRLRVCTVFLLFGCVLLVAAKGPSQKKKKKNKVKLRGYDLVDSVDEFWGGEEPEVELPGQKLDDLGDGDGKVSRIDWDKIGLPSDHFDYFDRDSDGILDKHEAYIWWMGRRSSKTMNLSEVSNPPRGHLKPFGGWKDPLPSAGLEYTKPYPHPRDFWRKHMDGYLPANLKGAQHGWGAMNWTREVLSERFGWVDAKLEPKVEGRSNSTAYTDLDKIAPEHRLSIAQYLRVEEGKNMYVVSIIPQAMAKEVAHPATLLCGSRRKILQKNGGPPYKPTEHMYPHEGNLSWMTHIFEANLWMGSGRTRSQFHYDKEWNVNCLLSGRKRWVFVNPFDYDESLNWARGNKFVREDPLNNRWTDWVYLDPDAVDLIVESKLRNMDYYELIQEPGDCIFIPYAMLHQVQKLDEEMQVAVSWMFLPETIYDEEACQEAPLARDLPLAAMDTLYLYTGKGIIPQGYNDPLNFVNELRSRMEERGMSYLTLDMLTRELTKGEAILAKMKKKTRTKKVQAIWDLLIKYAKDPAKGLHVGELQQVPLRIWCKPAAEGDSEGPLPCDRGQEYHLQDDAEYERMQAYIQEELAAAKAGSTPASFGTASVEHSYALHQRVWPPKRPPKQQKDEL